MSSRIVVVVLFSVIAFPARAGDMFTSYWDRYAVVMSGEPVARDSETSPAYRSQYAVLTLAQARAEAAARAARSVDDRAAPGAAAPSSKECTAAGCTCRRERRS